MSLNNIKTTKYEPIKSILDQVQEKIKKILKDEFNYTDENNPFGDQNLSKPFIWEAKNSFLKQKGLNPCLNGEDIPKKLLKAKRELEELKERKSKEEKRRLNKIQEDKRLDNEKKYQEYLSREKEFEKTQEEIRELLQREKKHEYKEFFTNQLIYFHLSSLCSKSC